MNHDSLPHEVGSRRAGAILALLCLAGVFLRLHGIDAMLPHAKEPDAHIVQQAQVLAGEPGPADKLAKYPHLLARAVVGLRRVWPERPLPPEAGLNRHLARAGRPVLEARLIVAAIALLAVPGTYFLARTWLAPGWSLCAAALVLFSLLFQSLSQQARPHAPLAALALFAVLAALRLRRRPSAGAYLGAGAAAGLAAGCLQSGLFAFLPLAAAHFLREGPRRRGDSARALLALIPLVAAGLAFYPFLFFAPPSPQASAPPPASTAAPESPPADAAAPASPRLVVTRHGLRYGQHRIVWSNFNGGGFRRVLWHLWSYEPALLVLAAVGLASALRGSSRWRGRPEVARDLAVVLAFAGAYLALLCAYRNTLARYVLPLLPYLACLAAAGLAVTARALEPRLRRWAPAAAVLVGLALPAYATVRLAEVRAAPDTIELAASWLAERVPADMPVAHGMNLDLPLVPDRESLDADAREEDRFQVGPWIDYLLALPELPAGPHFSLRRMPASSPLDRWRLRENLPGYVNALEAKVVVLLVRPGYREEGRGWRRAGAGEDAQTSERFRAELGQRGFLVARFTSSGLREEGGESFDFEYAAARRPHYTLQVLRARAMGPILEIYRMNR